MFRGRLFLGACNAAPDALPQSRPMLRLFILCFALLLPLQFAWAGAASYCEHETSSAGAEHFGHHTHVHESEGGKTAGGKLMADADCGACHASGPMLAAQGTGAHALPSSTTHGAWSPLLQIASAFARAPDRPQWLGLA
jgi:hypothetical protein